MDYLLWGIKWPVVIRMLIDAPKYETDDEKKKDTTGFSRDDIFTMSGEGLNLEAGKTYSIKDISKIMRK